MGVDIAIRVDAPSLSRHQNTGFNNLASVILSIIFIGLAEKLIEIDKLCYKDSKINMTQNVHFEPKCSFARRNSRADLVSFPDLRLAFQARILRILTH